MILLLLDKTHGFEKKIFVLLVLQRNACSVVIPHVLSEAN